MAEPEYVDDRDRINDAEIVRIDWPDGVEKPRFGIVRDYEEFPRWTKYCRFLDNNSFEYDLYDLHAHDWIEKAEGFDILVGFVSSELPHLQEMRERYYLLERFLGKATLPSADHALLYEDKNLEAYLSQVCGFPFINTRVSHEEDDALRLIEQMTYPVVCKMVPGSGSEGIELVRSVKHARRIVKQAFSRIGRASHLVYSRQKGYVHFQDYVSNDGYDVRAIVVGNWIFGYYRKVLKGDFRASGMNLVEKRELPEEAMRIAMQVNQVVKSPMLVVDMVHGLDGKYHIIEFSPVCQMEFPEQLHVKGVPGVYVFDGDMFHFEPGRYWVHELALREFLLSDYLPKVLAEKA
jgi:glutathione synthase/RimK-type ligase-like ATP-grasp enzyme